MKENELFKAHAEAQATYAEYVRRNETLDKFQNGESTCFHPPLKKDGTHNRLYRCEPCYEQAWNDHSKAQSLANDYRAVWALFDRIGLPVGDK